jgi:hypothetical protein
LPPDLIFVEFLPQKSPPQISEISKSENEASKIQSKTRSCKISAERLRF